MQKFNKKGVTMNLVELKQFAESELVLWNLQEKGWTVVFGTAHTVAGTCNPKRKEIRLSKSIAEVETDAFNIDTVRHEIAHALAGCHNNHNQVWKFWARKVGCSTRATYEESEAINKLVFAKTKYVMCFENLIVQTYMRKPAKKTIRNIASFWATGRKEETVGKLKIYHFNPAIHKEFL